MNPIVQAHALGQSLWYDNIQRGLLEKGDIAELIARDELWGMTSNPSIFNHSISKTTDYDEALRSMSWSGLPARIILDSLVFQDIRTAADLFLPVYEATSGKDGYVSLEVNPTLAYDTVRTVDEARRLWQAVNRPNVMIKIPATIPGLQAIQQTIAQGINVNITLIFSVKRYEAVIQAYLEGLKHRLGEGQSINHIASVASFFVSRVDTKVDNRLNELLDSGKLKEKEEQVRELFGKAAVANAQLAYALFERYFQGDIFKDLKSAGAQVQRPLWASTSTKNPAYSDVKYIEELVAPDTVNTMPLVTYEAFRSHGSAQVVLPGDLVYAKQIFDNLNALGIDIDLVTQELEEEGVKAFSDSYESLVATIENRRQDEQRQLGPYANIIQEEVDILDTKSVVQRLYRHDPNLWTTDEQGQGEIKRRLGWLDLPETSQSLASDLLKFADEIHRAGFERLLLLGMGGSSLAPEVMSTFTSSFQAGSHSGGPILRILDSTDPIQVSDAYEWAFELDRRERKNVDITSGITKISTLFIVSSKSGGTAEVKAFLEFFWEKTRQLVGDNTGQYFIAITDPGTNLETIARQRKFRRIFLADPSVGGRNSVLSAFGLVPAALMGYDVQKLLSRAAWMARQCRITQPAASNPGLVLGTILGKLARNGQDKLTLVTDPQLESFGAWLEQLIAESSGKSGKGIIPVDGEPVDSPGSYGKDRIFVYLRKDGEKDQAIERLRAEGYPAITIPFEDLYDIGSEFYRWEVATAIACSILGVNSFDQPDVQDSKTRTLEKINAYNQGKTFEEGQVVWDSAGIKIYGNPIGLPEAGDLAIILRSFLSQAKPGDYVAMNAYLPRDNEARELLGDLRIAIRSKTGLATTVGFGPRFLHSTGQLHKGGPNTGLFLLITKDDNEDIPIPGQGYTFATLERAQALGDLEALISRGRRVIRLHLAEMEKIQLISDAIKR